jgi:hypothetical protein
MTGDFGRSLGVCTYCGQTKWVSADHVPPKNLFPMPYPPDLWTVPACDDCNQGFSKDDDYFRVWLTIAEGAKGQSARDKIIRKVVRGLQREEAQGLLRSLYDNSSMLPRFSPSGLYLGQQPAISFDGARIGRTAARIVKGLFYRVRGHRLPDDHTVNVTHSTQFPQAFAVDPEVELALRQFIAATNAEPAHQLGDSFAFKWLQSPNGPDHSMWLLYFYGQMQFFCTTFAQISIANSTVDAEVARNSHHRFLIPESGSGDADAERRSEP